MCLRGCYLRITEGKTALNMGGAKPLTWSPGVAKGKKLQDPLSQFLGSLPSLPCVHLLARVVSHKNHVQVHCVLSLHLFSAVYALERKGPYPCLLKVHSQNQQRLSRRKGLHVINSPKGKTVVQIPTGCVCPTALTLHKSRNPRQLWKFA